MPADKQARTIGQIMLALVGTPIGYLGVLLDLVRKLNNKPTGPELFERLKRLVNETRKCAGKLLKHVTTVIIPATTEKFIVKEKFVKNTSDDAEVKIGYLGDRFKRWFGEKTEDPIAEQTLQSHELLKHSVDGPIISELGGEEMCETTLTELHYLLSKQGKGEEGILLTNGYTNIFYVRDYSGCLRAVNVPWDSGNRYWSVDAYSIELPLEWSAAYQVFSRNS